MDKMKIFCLSAMLCAFSSSMIFADSDSTPGPINEAKVRCQKEAEAKVEKNYNLNAINLTQKNIDQMKAEKKEAIKAEKARCQQEANKELRQFMQELPPKTINPNGGSFKSDKAMMNHGM